MRSAVVLVGVWLGACSFTLGAAAASIATEYANLTSPTFVVVQPQQLP